jgi:hypothetical protein
MLAALSLALCAGVSPLAQSAPALTAVSVPGRTEARITGAQPDALVAFVLGLEPASIPLPGGALLGVSPPTIAGVAFADALGHGALASVFPTTAARGLSFFGQGVVFAPAEPTPIAPLLVTPVRALRVPALDEPVDLVVLFGQSNAEGGAPRTGLPASLVGPLPALRTWNDAAGAWQALEAGVNNALFAGGMWVGPEMGIAEAAAAAPRPLWLVKLALYSTTLGPNPGPWNEWGANAGELYAELLRRIDAAAAGARSLGLAPRVRLVCMMQGESDALDPVLAASYARYLDQFVRRMRADLAARGLDAGTAVPFRIGLVSSQLITAGFVSIPAVRAAQQQVAAALPACTVIDTSGLPLEPDGVHFSLPGVLQLGRAFVAPTPQ